jgi:Na+/melibiose symporter-like transporter
MAADPILDPPLPPAAERPTPSLWRNSAFQRIWTAATVSIFGSLITRLALPFVAILTLGANSFDVALMRAMELLAGLSVGLVAGAWVDRLRRRPVLIWADLGRAALLLTIPAAAFGGWLSIPQMLLVTFLMAVLTTFFDVADAAFLPTIVPRRDLLRANGALAASSSVSEFAAFGSAGFLVQLLTGPIAILIDAFSYIVSALLIGTVRVTEPPPRPKAEREPIISEVKLGLRLVLGNPILRGMTLATMALAGLWGIFGATWYLFAIQDLGLDTAAIGVIAAVGGLSSLGGAVLTPRLTRRFGIGRLMLGAMLLTALGNLFIPLAPSGAPLLAMAFLIGQQLVADGGATAFSITEVSVRQSIVGERELGRVNATVRVAVLVVGLLCTLGAGGLALFIGLRATAFLAPVGGLLAAAAIWFSPVRRLRQVETS